LIDFANADWAKRRQLLTDRADLLLSDLVEPVFERLLEANEDEDAIHELERVEAMQALLSSLPGEQPDLFRAALLRDLADARFALPADHSIRKIVQVESYYREALPYYQAVDRPISVAFIQRSLGDTLSEQGRYDESLVFFRTAIEVLKADEYRKDDAAWALSSYASALDNLGRTEEALAAYAEALALLPNTPELLRNRSDALIHARRLEDAEADLTRAVELNGNENSLYLWLRRAQLAIARGNGLLGDQMLDEVIKRDPSQDVLLQRVQSAWLLSDLNTAQDGLRLALEKANQGDRVAISREMKLLLDEHPNLPGKNEMLKMLN
jgi:tetratricopeptide (TPR) repeat protein